MAALPVDPAALAHDDEFHVTSGPTDSPGWRAHRDAWVRLRSTPDGIVVDGVPAWHSASAAAGDTHEHALFAEWRVAEAGLQVRVDRYGVSPLYVWADGQQLALSPSLPALLRLGAPRSLDFTALAAAFRLGFFVGNDTPFAAIRAVPGGEWNIPVGGPLPFTDAVLPSRDVSRLSRDAAIDAYIELFRESVARGLAAGGRIAVPLSGGRDSRHILLEMIRQGRPPDLCMTVTYYPPRPNVDQEVASALAQRLGVTHRTVPQGPSQLTSLRRHFRDTGLCTLTPSSFVQPIADQCVQHGFDCLFDGLAGDTLSAGHFSSPEFVRLYAASEFEALAGALLGRFQGMDEGFLQAVLPPEVRARLGREVAVARLVRELERHAAAPNPMASFVFFNRTRRDIAMLPMRVYRAVPTVVCPYLHPPLFDLLYSLPPALVVDHRFHDDTIARAYPEHADFPYAQRRSSQVDRRQQAGFALEIARELARKGRRHFIRAGYAWPRVLRCLVDPGFLPAISSFGPRLAYLAEFGAAMEAGGTRVTSNA